MARLDDDELNISPEVAAALGYPVRRANAARPIRNARAGAQPRHIPLARREEPLGLPIFATLIAIVCVICLVAAGTAHNQATAEPSQQVSQQSVPVVDKQEQQSDAIPVGTAESAMDVSEPAVQVPVQRDDVQPAQEIQYAVHVQVHETAQSSDVEVNQENEIPEYLPADYDTGRVTAPLFLVREMPRGGAVDFLGYVPPGTCLLYERLNANGWRRVVSLDGRYAGYAEVYPTVAYQPRPMRPELLEAIAMIRRIP
jgi:hypothetical protein